MQGTMNVLDRNSGHDTLVWDTEVPESVEVVRARFDTLIAEGMLAYSLDPHDVNKGEVLRHFDETATEIVVSAPLVGG